MPNIGCLLGSAYQQQLSRLATALTDEGLDILPSEYLVLRGLYTKDGMQQCDVASLLGKDKAGVSRCIRTMERKGLVSVKTISHKCRRIWLTDKSREIEPLIMKIAGARHDALLNLASSEDIETFVRVLKLILNQK
ncbi:MAG: MarR family transcriptional regulator [Paramuribaculum sp.]|nr:MarR family transcriptional regulator [Paramuribaculum sp.]MDE6304764.1 MarR family transcriptional regulator [Paramuribaculum sp.]